MSISFPDLPDDWTYSNSSPGTASGLLDAVIFSAARTAGNLADVATIADVFGGSLRNDRPTNADLSYEPDGNTQSSTDDAESMESFKTLRVVAGTRKNQPGQISARARRDSLRRQQSAPQRIS
jgi:hypothetical protein